MITTKTRFGVEYKFDTDTGNYLNPTTDRWVKNPRPPRQTAGKVESSSFYLKWTEIEDYIQRLDLKPQETERYYVLLTKIYFLNSHFDSERVCYYDSIDLRNVGGSKYSNILKHLKMDGVLDPYQIGTSRYGKPMTAYTIAPDYLPKGSRSHVRVEFETTDTGLKRFRQRRRQNLRDAQSYGLFERTKQYKFDLEKLTQEKFVSIIETKYIHYKNKIRVRNEFDGQSKPALTWDQYLMQSMAFYDLILLWNEMPADDRIEFFQKDHFGNRFHSIFTRIPNEFRQYACIDGQYFSRCVDLTASQPTLAADIIRDRVGECDYVRDVESGQFYERMMQRLDVESRDTCKTIFMSMMFGRNNARGHRLLETIYPKAGAFIAEQKKEGGEMVYYRDGKMVEKWIKPNAMWAQQLQRRESQLMSRIWKALDTMDIHYLPVHDAVYVTQGDCDDARAVFRAIVGEELSVDFDLSD